MSALPTSCQLSCQNGGYCNFVSSNEQKLQQIFTSGGLIQKCICPPGFTGIACETVVEECQLPQLTCHNGIPCSLNLQGEWDGHYVCDCSVADAMSKFAGSMCRNPATSYCGSGEITNRSFCTNGGLCLENLMGGHENSFDTHKGCKCPPEFEGEHCEYAKGMSPSSQKGSNSDRAYITDISVDSSPALTMSHAKNSKELSATDEEGTLPVQTGVHESVSMAPPTEAEPVSHSKSSVLQSNNVVIVQSTPKIEHAPSIDPINHKSADKPNTGSVFGLIISCLGITLFGTALLVRSRRQRQLKRRIVHDHTSQHLASLDRNNYTDETPIRVRIMAEDEDNELELDEVLGEDDDVVSIGECSLEEIELEENMSYGEYLRNISDDFEGEGGESVGSEKEQSSGYFPNIFA